MFDSHTATLSNDLYNYSREFGYCDVLIDPMGGNDWQELLESLNENIAPRLRLRDKMFAADSAKAPLLVRIDHRNFEQLDGLASIAFREAIDPTCQGRSVCAFIQSEFALPRLAQMLQKALSISVERQAIYFRYFDPRVIHHVPMLLSDEILVHWLPGISRWAYIAWDGTWAQHCLPKPPSGAMSIHLRLSAVQWAGFAAIEHFNAMVAAFAQHNMPCQPADTQQRMDEIRAVLGLGLKAPRDTACYLLLSARLGYPLAQHPGWSQLLPLVRQGVPLADALEATGPL